MLYKYETRSNETKVEKDISRYRLVNWSWQAIEAEHDGKQFYILELVIIPDLWILLKEIRFDTYKEDAQAILLSYVIKVNFLKQKRHRSSQFTWALTLFKFKRFKNKGI